MQELSKENMVVSQTKLIVTSVGRRGYLVQWFRDAAAQVECELSVIAADSDSHSPGLEVADHKQVLPPISSPEYLDVLVRACAEHDVRMLLSLHDYEIAAISTGGLGRLEQHGVVAVVPPESTLGVVADKLATVEALRNAGLKAPGTWLATEVTEWGQEGRCVVKHRYGSGSTGVFVVDSAHLSQAILISSLSALAVDGSRPDTPDPSLVIVQEMVVGNEYGLDVVCDFDGAFQGVLARKKLRMRAGETDRAVTVDPAEFEPLARKLASTLELRGNTDVDVIVTPEGDQYIIDINPRFGGGYPFMHMAGANVPACYLAWALGREIDPAWLQYEIGVVSSKYEAIQRSGV